MTSKCWEALDTPLRRFVAAVIDGLRPSDCSWREFLRANGEEPGKARQLDEVEVQRLLAILVRNTDQHPERLTRLFGKEGAGERLRDQLAYLVTLRNKYRHDPYVPATEQVADLLMVGRLSDQLSNTCEGLDSAERALQAALEEQLAIYWPSVKESGMAPVPEAPMDTPILEALQGRFDGLENELRMLREAFSAQTGGAEKPESPGQARLIVAELQALLRSESTNVLERISALDARLLQLSTETSRLGTMVRDPQGGHSQESDRFDRFSADEEAAVPLNIDALLERISTESRTARPRDARATPNYSAAQIRDQLIQLRRRILAETGSASDTDGLLRKKMMDRLIRKEIKTEKQFYTQVPEAEIASTSQRQLHYLPDVLSIMQGLRTSRSRPAI